MSNRLQSFDRHRLTQDNIRRTLKYSEIKHLLHTEKEFDRVNWEFLYLIFRRFGFNEKAIQCIKANYKNPTVRLKMNGKT